MSTLQKLKAYFGMVPADDDYQLDDGYPADDDFRRGYAEDDYHPGYHAGYDEPQPRPRSRGRYVIADDYDDLQPVRRGRGLGTEPAVHGALAVDRQPEPVAPLRPVPEQPRVAVRDPLSRITTLHPTSYLEARAIGEHYREGTPVIINLTEMDNADAKRLVDFAAGLAFALHGSMDKVTNKVFLLSPPDVDVTAEDRRRIAEGGLFLRQ
jgi:cell division inhibitor SepF